MPPTWKGQVKGSGGARGNCGGNGVSAVAVAAPAPAQRPPCAEEAPRAQKVAQVAPAPAAAPVRAATVPAPMAVGVIGGILLLFAGGHGWGSALPAVSQTVHCGQRCACVRSHGCESVHWRALPLVSALRTRSCCCETQGSGSGERERERERMAAGWRLGSPGGVQERWSCHNAGRLTWRLLVLSLWAQRGTATWSHRVCNIATTHGSCLAARHATIKRVARIKGWQCC